MKYHEEKKEGEIWLGNYRIGGFYPNTNIEKYLKHLKTLRLGVQAYDIEGKKLSQKIYRPLFVHRSEYDEYNRVMERISSRRFIDKNK